MMATPWALIALGAVAWMMSSSGSSGSSGGPQPRRVVPDAGMPDRYARGVLPKLTARYRDALVRAAAARWGAHWFPGVPLSAMLAAGATSTGRSERGGPPDYATGLWGVEWPRVVEWARDDRTVRDLGRAVDVTPEAFARDVEAQAYLGFRSYRAHLDTLLRTTPPEVRPSEGSAWLWRLALASYSSGPGTVGAMVRRAAGALARVPEIERWAELGREVDRAARGGATTFGGITIAGRWHAAHTVIRNEERHAAGELLARTTPELVTELVWYGGDVPVDVLAALQRDAG